MPQVQCENCAKGRYSSAGLEVCVACEPGFYQDETGQGPLHELDKKYQGQNRGGCKWCDSFLVLNTTGLEDKVDNTASRDL